MSFQLSAQAITAQTAITRMSVRGCSTLRRRGSATARKCPTSRSMAMIRSPSQGERIISRQAIYRRSAFMRCPCLPSGRFGDSPIPALNNFGANAAAGGWVRQDQYPRVLGDVNGDGRADIVGFGFSATYTAFGQANGTFAAPILASNIFGSGAVAGGWFSEDQSTRLLGDVNGDGRADIVGFGFSATYTALGQADGTFAAPIVASNVFGSGAVAGGWVSQDQATRLLGDVNGDGRADIVGFGFAGTYPALGQADGTFETPAFSIA